MLLRFQGREKPCPARFIMLVPVSPAAEEQQRPTPRHEPPITGRPYRYRWQKGKMASCYPSPNANWQPGASELLLLNWVVSPDSRVGIIMNMEMTFPLKT